MNTLKITHVITFGALSFATYEINSRAERVCNCSTYPLPEGSGNNELRMMILQDACFGSYFHLVETLIWILWGMVIIFGIGLFALFCTDACDRCK